MATVKKCSKNKNFDDAHQNELIKQSENRSKIGQFSVNWLIFCIVIITGFAVFVLVYYVFWLVQDPLKLEHALGSIYTEIKYFAVENQSIIAVLMFGNKFMSKRKN